MRKISKSTNRGQQSPALVQDVVHCGPGHSPAAVTQKKSWKVKSQLRRTIQVPQTVLPLLSGPEGGQLAMERPKSGALSSSTGRKNNHSFSLYFARELAFFSLYFAVVIGSVTRQGRRVLNSHLSTKVHSYTSGVRISCPAQIPSPTIPRSPHNANNTTE